MVVVAGLVGVLGLIQLGSDALLGSYAVPGSFPAELPASLGLAIDGALVKVLPWPMLHELLADAALRDGNLELAQAQIEALPPSKYKRALEGRLYEAQGKTNEAFLAYLDAGDIATLAQSVQRADPNHIGDVKEAIRRERLIVERLRNDPARLDALAAALWTLGSLDAEQGYREADVRAAAWARALADYQAALELTPLSEQVLLAAGNQALLLDEPRLALTYFRRAVDGDPRSADAFAGLGKAQARLGNVPAARAALATALLRDPNSVSARELAREIRTGRPVDLSLTPQIHR